jgi:hypothetical protein
MLRKKIKALRDFARWTVFVHLPIAMQNPKDANKKIPSLFREGIEVLH